MLSVFICEDDPKQREYMEAVIEKHILIKELDMELTLASDNPVDILKHLAQSKPIKRGLFFLDIDLRHEMNGIILASKIRDIDSAASIIFITSHGGLSYLTFRYKVEAMDYIVKEKTKQVAKRIRECIDVAYARYLNDTSPQRGGYQVKAGGRVWLVPYEEIMFFESHPTPHKMILHMQNSQLEFYGSIRETAKISPDFYRCHKSFVVNRNNIKSVDTIKREAEMVNGEIVLVSTRKIKELLQMWHTNQ